MHRFGGDFYPFQHSTKNTCGKWRGVNDSVMGGVSRGEFKLDPAKGFLEFSGNLSLENNGGFASIRTNGSENDLSEFDGFLLRVRGEGRKYYFTVRTNMRIYAGSYRITVPTLKDKWTKIRLPFEKFYATSFGRRLQNAPPLNSTRIRSIGVKLADKRPGAFEMGIERIEVYQERDRIEEKDHLKTAP